VVWRRYPPIEYEGVLTCSEAASAYASLAWTPPLFAFISKVASQYPGIRIFGICFGHQAVAMSLAGTCVANPKGWEVGTYEVELSATGKLIFGRDILVC
jgi:GMP synthase-like glutamine amidotransferase